MLYHTKPGGGGGGGFGGKGNGSPLSPPLFPSAKILLLSKFSVKGLVNNAKEENNRIILKQIKKAKRHFIVTS